MRVILLTVACLVALTSGASAQTDPPASPDLVKQLVALMAARNVDTIATMDPEDSGRFVAALAFPDVQLLVVSAKHRSADYLKQQIAKQQFRDVYVALQDRLASERLFFHDMGCDGFRTEGETVDVLYEDNDRKTMFDGNWDAQSLPEADYLAKRKEAEQKYVRALTVLIDAAKRLRSITEP